MDDAFNIAESTHNLKWDNGRSLSLMPFEDSFTAIQEEQLYEKILGKLTSQTTGESHILVTDQNGGTARS